MPTGVLLLVKMVKVEFPLALKDGGANAALVFVGRPETLKVTDPVKVLFVTIVTVNTALLLAVTLWEGGVAPMRNGSGWEAGVLKRLNCWLAPPLGGSWSSWVPALVLAPGTSRYKPLRRLIRLERPLPTDWTSHSSL